MVAPLATWPPKTPLQLTGLQIFGLGDAGVTERHVREGHRSHVCEVTGRQRDIFDRLGYGLSATS